MKFDKDGNLTLADSGDIVFAEGECRPLVEAFAKLPDSVLLFGKKATPAQVMAWAVRTGFDPASGRGRDYAGMVPIIINNRTVNLTWEAA
jgi:hypothetical protein